MKKLLVAAIFAILNVKAMELDCKLSNNKIGSIHKVNPLRSSISSTLINIGNISDRIFSILFHLNSVIDNIEEKEASTIKELTSEFNEIKESLSFVWDRYINLKHTNSLERINFDACNLYKKLSELENYLGRQKNFQIIIDFNDSQIYN